MNMSVEHKYAVQGAHPDQFNIDFGDGIPQGPGPGHYPTLREAFIGGADWLWIFAEASRRIGRKGAEGREWDAFIFFDRSTGAYGFTTAEPHGHSSTESPTKRITQLRRRLGGNSYNAMGYIHSHPSGAFAFGYSSEVFSLIGVDPETGAIDGDLAQAYIFSPQEIWMGLLTPTGAVKRVRLLGHVKAEINRVRRDEPLGVPSRAVLRILQRQSHLVFFEEMLRPAQGRTWAPGSEDWRKKAIDAAARELMHHPRNEREARRFDQIRSAGGLS